MPPSDVEPHQEDGPIRDVQNLTRPLPVQDCPSHTQGTQRDALVDVERSGGFVDAVGQSDLVPGRCILGQHLNHLDLSQSVTR